MERILVTGGAGYIGSHVVRKLLAKGYSVRILDKLAFGDESIQELKTNPKFELMRGDIRHIEDVMAAMKGVDAVIDLAGIVGDPACALDEETTLGVNYEATKLILSIAKYYRVKRFIFASTCSVYGASDNTILNENSPLNPVSLYAETKINSEKEILEACTKDFTTSILRLSTIYGASPRMRFDLVVNIMTAKAVTDGKISVFGGSQWRPLVHVQDCAEALINCLEARADVVRAQIFNVGSEEQNYTIDDIAKIVQSVIPSASIESVGDDADRRSYRVSFEKIKKVLGFQAKHSVEEGVKEVAELIKSGKIKNYRDDVYYNVKYRFK
jgi:nucleoside-diphosphate-sugar epimerase